MCQVCNCLTFLAAALGLLGYLYSSTPTVDAHGRKLSLAAKLFIPTEPYGVIIYFLSAAMLLGGIGVLLFALKPLPWSTAYDNEQEDCISEKYEGYLKYMQKCYLKSSKTNMGSYGKKRDLLDISFKMVLLGGTLLLVIKKFGG